MENSKQDALRMHDVLFFSIFISLFVWMNFLLDWMNSFLVDREKNGTSMYSANRS